MLDMPRDLGLRLGLGHVLCPSLDSKDLSLQQKCPITLYSCADKTTGCAAVSNIL